MLSFNKLKASTLNVLESAHFMLHGCFLHPASSIEKVIGFLHALDENAHSTGERTR
jgi:hypothetical protein